MVDLLIQNFALTDGRTGMSVAAQGGVIVAVQPGLNALAHQTVDAGVCA